MKRFMFLPIVAALAGCSTSDVLTAAPDAGERIATYALPRALIEVELTATYPARRIETGAPAAVDPFADPGETPPPAVRFVDNPRALKGRGTELTLNTFRILTAPGPSVELRYAPDSFADDTLTIELDEFSLLKQVKLETQDQTGAFLVKLADIGIGLAKLPAVYPASVAKISDDGVVTRTITAIIDPMETGRRTLMDGAVTLDVTDADRAGAGMPLMPAPAAATCVNEICHPMLTTRLIRFTAPGGVLEDRLVIVPDPSRLARLDLRRADFVRRTLTAEFDKGVLRKATMTKPSQALAIAQTPVDILAAVIALPSELIQLKIDTTGGEAKLADQRVREIDAQIRLLEAMKRGSAAGLDANAPAD